MNSVKDIISFFQHHRLMYLALLFVFLILGAIWYNLFGSSHKKFQVIPLQKFQATQAVLQTQNNVLDSTLPPHELLLASVIYGELENVRIILDRYPELINLYEHYWNSDTSPVHAAARYGHVDLLDFLLQKGMDPNFYFSRVNVTPLEEAMMMHRPKIVAVLAHHGVDTNAWAKLPPDTHKKTLIDRNSYSGCSPLFYALFTTPFRRSSKNELMSVLLRHGADVNQSTPDGYAPLHYVVARPNDTLSHKLLEGDKQLILVKFLLSQPDIDVNVTSAVEHLTPLHFLLRSISYSNSERYPNKFNMLKLLIEHGARTDIKTYDGKTAIDFAKKYNNGNREILAILAKAKNPPIVKEERD